MTLIFPSPVSNASLGVSASIVVYFITFYSLYYFYKDVTPDGAPLTPQEKLIKCLKMIGLKEIFEQGTRFLFHILFMYLGLTAFEASPIAQLLAGGLGHLSIPIFANLGKIAERKI